MADVNVANIVATVEVRPQGLDAAERQVRALQAQLDLVVAEAEAAGTAFDTMGASGAQAAQKLATLRSAAAAMEVRFESLLSLQEQQGKLSAEQTRELNALSGALFTIGEDIKGVEREARGYVSTVDKMVRADREKERLSRDLAVAEARKAMILRESGDVQNRMNQGYRAGYNEVRAYSEGVYRLLSTLGGGNAIMSTAESVLGSLTRNATQWVSVWEGVKAQGGGIKDFFAQVTTRMRSMIGVLGGVAVVVGVATYAFQKWMQRRQRLRQLEEEYTKALQETNDVLSEQVSMLTMTTLAKDDDLKTLNALGLSVEQFNQMVSQGINPLEQYREALEAALGRGDISLGEADDLWRKVSEIGDAMTSGAGKAAIWREALANSQEAQREAFNTDTLRTYAEMMGIPLATLREITREYMNQVDILDEVILAQAATQNQQIAYARLVGQSQALQEQYRLSRLPGHAPMPQEDLYRLVEVNNAIEQMRAEAEKTGLDLDLAGIIADVNAEVESLWRPREPLPIAQGMYNAEANARNLEETLRRLNESVYGPERAEAKQITKGAYAALDVGVQALQGAVQPALGRMFGEAADPDVVAQYENKHRELYGAMMDAAEDLRVTAGREYERVSEAIETAVTDLSAESISQTVGNRVIAGLKGALKLVTGYLDAQSPSKLWRDKVGAPIPEGVAEGVGRGMRLIDSTGTEIIKGLGMSIKAAQQMIDKEMAGFALEDAQQRLEDAQWDVKTLQRLKDRLGADAMDPRSQKAIETAEKNLFFTKRAAAAGLATQADVVLAQVALERAKEQAQTIGEALKDALKAERRAELAVIAAAIRESLAGQPGGGGGGGGTSSMWEAIEEFLNKTQNRMFVNFNDTFKDLPPLIQALKDLGIELDITWTNRIEVEDEYGNWLRAGEVTVTKTGVGINQGGWLVT